jgi:hypothetical protein
VRFKRKLTLSQGLRRRVNELISGVNFTRAHAQCATQKPRTLNEAARDEDARDLPKVSAAAAGL